MNLANKVLSDVTVSLLLLRDHPSCSVILYTQSKTISWMFKVEIYAIWRLYGLLMSFSLTALHDTSKLKHTAKVQIEEHNNKMTKKSCAPYHISRSGGQAALNQEIKWAPKLGACGAGSH